MQGRQRLDRVLWGPEEEEGGGGADVQGFHGWGWGWGWSLVSILEAIRRFK